MSKECGLRHTDNIDDLTSMMWKAVNLAEEDDRFAERGNAKEIAEGTLLVWKSRLKGISKRRDRENLPKTAEPKSEEQEVQDATEAVFLEIQGNIEKHGTAGYATEKDIYNPTITTNRKTDYLPENLLKLSKILIGVSARIGELTSQDPETREAHQKVINEIHQILHANLIGIIERNQTPQKRPGFLKRFLT